MLSQVDVGGRGRLDCVRGVRLIGRRCNTLACVADTGMKGVHPGLCGPPKRADTYNRGLQH